MFVYLELKAVLVGKFETCTLHQRIIACILVSGVLKHIQFGVAYVAVVAAAIVVVVVDVIDAVRVVVATVVITASTKSNASLCIPYVLSHGY